MEFLKGILGDELYKQVEEKLNAHNGNEANKEKQIKIGNLGSGEYVGKGKFDAEIEKLNSIITGKDTEIGKANELIEQLKKSAKGNEELQGKFAQYEQEKAALQKQLVETKLNAALKVALLAAKANPDDIDYLTFKLNEKLRGEGKTLELDENESIKGWNDHLSGLKTQCPKQFENAGTIEIDPLPLQTGGNDTGITKEQFDKMGYQSRLKLKQESPEVYAQLTGKEN